MPRQRVLARLLGQFGRSVSGQDIAREMGISRTSIWKVVTELRMQGYRIEASPNRGYRLVGCPDILDPPLIREGLTAEVMGREILYYPRLASTNALARQLAPAAVEGTTVLAEIQTEGRGRMDRRWESPPGGIWISVILKPALPPALAPRVNMLATVALARSLRGLYGLEARIKWPNDLVIGSKKVSGILAEVDAEMDRMRYAVVGMGINANIGIDLLDPGWNATSLQQELGSPVSRAELVRTILMEMDALYRQIYDGFSGVINQCRELSATLGQDVRVILPEGEILGRAVELDPEGALMVEISGGETRRVMAGDCIHLRKSRGQERIA